MTAAAPGTSVLPAKFPAPGLMDRKRGQIAFTYPQ
jgi:hypothetical protein